MGFFLVNLRGHMFAVSGTVKSVMCKVPVGQYFYAAVLKDCAWHNFRTIETMTVCVFIQGFPFSREIMNFRAVGEYLWLYFIALAIVIKYR